MSQIPVRLVAHLFLPVSLRVSRSQLGRLRRRLTALCAGSGRKLVGLVVDRGPASLDPAEHVALVRIALGEADGLVLLRMPLEDAPTDGLLAPHARDAVTILTSEELRARGLLPQRAGQKAATTTALQHAGAPL